MSRRIIWHLEVTPHLNDQLEEYIAQDAFKTKSEFIRTAVRDRLEEERKKIVSKNRESLLQEKTKLIDHDTNLAEASH